MSGDEAVKRAEMRARLREWGGSSRLTRALEHDMRVAAREYDVALSELREARRRADNGPGRGTAHAAARRAAQNADAIARQYAERYAALRRQVEARAGTDAGINNALGALDETSRLVLHMRYARGLSWTAVAVSAGHDESWARKVERRAVDELRRIYDKRQSR